MLATGIGIGYFPLVPGTLGTFLAIPLSFAVNRLATDSLFFGLLAMAGFVVCAVWLSNRGETLLGRKDPENIVIDEIAGFLVANFLAPPGWTTLVLALVFFRIFDIIKVFPAARLQSLAGGLGIVSDDLIAGAYTFVVVRVIFLVALK